MFDKIKRALAARGKLAASERGMTLIEIMIVLTIMAAIASVVAVNVVGQLEEANKQQARIEIGQIKNMLDTYYAMTNPHAYPDNLSALKEKKQITNEIPKDPWGNKYVYRKKNRTEYELFSKGPDGQQGTQDDIKKAKQSKNNG